MCDVTDLLAPAKIKGDIASSAPDRIACKRASSISFVIGLLLFVANVVKRFSNMRTSFRSDR